MRRLPYCAALLLAAPAWADGVAPSPLASLVQVVFALALVVGAIIACAWALRRVQGKLGGLPQYLKVVGGVPVGPRERVVVVEMGDEWLVLGVTNQQVNLLTRRPRPDDLPPSGGTLAEPPFAQWLKAALSKTRPGAARADDPSRPDSES